MTIAELEHERRIGRRIIRAGDVVAIRGEGYGRVMVAGHLVPGFRVLGFRGDDVDVFGARTATKAPSVRTFPVTAIGARHRPPRE